MHAERRRGNLEILLEKWIGVGFRGGDVILGIFLATDRMERQNWLGTNYGGGGVKVTLPAGNLIKNLAYRLQYILHTHIYMFNTMNIFSCSVPNQGFLVAMQSCLPCIFHPKTYFWFAAGVSLSTVRFSVTWKEQRVVAWMGFPSGDPHTGIWYSSLPSTRYWRTPWIAAALGNVLRVSPFSFQVLWTIWTGNGATLLALCCIPLADSAGQFKARNVSWIFGFIIGLSSKAAHRA